MDAKLVAKYLTALREKSGLTIEAVAEKSGRSESTVKNLLSGKTEDPRLDTVAPVIYAMAGSIDEMYTGKKDVAKEYSLSSIKEMYEFQLSEHRKTEESHITNIRAHYEQHRHDTIDNYEKRLADKDEIIKLKDEHAKMLVKVILFLVGLSLVCIAVLVALLIAEVMNPSLGWLRY